MTEDLVLSLFSAQRLAKAFSESFRESESVKTVCIRLF